MHTNSCHKSRCKQTASLDHNLSLLWHAWLIVNVHFDNKQTSDHAGASAKTINGTSLLLESKIT